MNAYNRPTEEDGKLHLLLPRTFPESVTHRTRNHLATDYGSIDDHSISTNTGHRNLAGVDEDYVDNEKQVDNWAHSRPRKDAAFSGIQNMVLTEEINGNSNCNIAGPMSSESTGSQSVSKINELFKRLRVSPVISQLLVYSFLPLLIWLVLYLVAGSDNLPGGTLFLLVLLECGGRLLGFLASLIRLPPMVGMLGLGIALKNINLNLMQNWSPYVSAPIRQIALAIILTRAGFGLDLNTLVKFKWLVLRLAVLPTVLEALSVSVATHVLLGFPWIWGLLVGFVVAAVSPAVIVPRILELKAQGYGEQKGIPTVILAAASLDNVVAISLFGTALGFIFANNRGITAMLLQCPFEVLAGIGFGIVWGSLSGFVFTPRNIEDMDADECFVKGGFVLGGGIISIFGFKLINFAGAGALGCIISAFVTCVLWKRRGFPEKEINQIKWGFTFLWKIFEPLLFGVIGCQIILNELDPGTVGLSIAALFTGATVRFLITFGSVCFSGLSFKERLFIAIAWIPKATVQAAIGPTALDYARIVTTSDSSELQRLAQDVLTIAVVVILLTAPVGEFAVMLTGPIILSKQVADVINTPVNQQSLSKKK